MKKNIFLLMTLLFISIQFCSCITEYPKGGVFDEEKFNAQKEQWKSLNLKKL